MHPCSQNIIRNNELSLISNHSRILPWSLTAGWSQQTAVIVEKGLTIQYCSHSNLTLKPKIQSVGYYFSVAVRS